MMDTLSLDGEVLVGWFRGEGRRAFVMRDYQVCKMEGRAFISGQVYYPNDPRADVVRVHVALDEVQCIYEYETKESWKQRNTCGPRKRKKWRLFHKTGNASDSIEQKFGSGK